MKWMLTTAQIKPNRQQTTVTMTSTGKLRGDWQLPVTPLAAA